MGYYTNFSVAIDGVDDTQPILDRLAEIAGEDDLRSGFAYAKWYQSAPDLAAVSAEFPAARITLWCAGEDGDHWKLCAIGGITHECQGRVVYTPNPLWGEGE